MLASTLSAELRICGKPFTPQSAIKPLLAGIARALGPQMLGHIKGVANFPNGALFASTVGMPSAINFQIFGEVPKVVSELRFELTCIIYDVAAGSLQTAVVSTMNALKEDYQIKGDFYEDNHQH